MTAARLARRDQPAALDDEIPDQVNVAMAMLTNEALLEALTVVHSPSRLERRWAREARA